MQISRVAGKLTNESYGNFFGQSRPLLWRLLFCCMACLLLCSADTRYQIFQMFFSLQ